MADSDLHLIKTLELRLLRSSLSPSPSPPPPPPSSPSSPLLRSIAAAVSSIESGDYAAALASDAARRLLRLPPSWRPRDSADSAAELHAAVEAGVDAFVRDGAAAWLGVLGEEEEEEDGAERSARLLFVLCVGAAALLAFNQANITGPPSEFRAVPICFLGEEEGEMLGIGAEAWELWAQKQLMATGCLLLGKLSMLQYLVLANTLLIKTKDLCFEMNCFGGVRTVSWWLGRALFVHQRILDETSSSLFDLIQIAMRETVDHFGQSQSVTAYWGSEVSGKEINEIVTMANLEMGIVEHAYGRVDSAKGSVWTQNFCNWGLWLSAC